MNYYFDRGVYESKGFSCDKRKAEFMRTFVASDETYSRYDTLEKINHMLDDIENKDTMGVIKKLKDIKSSTDLQAKEIRYISGIIDRINSEVESAEKWQEVNRELEELKNKLEKVS